MIDDGHSLLLVDLARGVADNAEKEAEATAVARRNWWAQARESLLSLFTSAHNSPQACREPRLSPRSEDGGKGAADVDAIELPAPEKKYVPASPGALPLIRDRLDNLLRAEETRAAKSTRDILAAADTVEAAGSGGEAGEQGPLHLAVVETQRLSSEALGRCLDAVEAARSDPFAKGEKGDERSKVASPAEEGGATASLTQGSGSGSGDGGRRCGTHTPEQGMALFLSRLEAGAVQLAAASFEAEVRRLVVGPGTPLTAAEAVASLPRPPPDTTIEEKGPSLPLEDSPPPDDLTRSQLDLRRAARVKAFARALGEMLCRVSEALQKKTLQVGPRLLPRSVDVPSGRTMMNPGFYIQGLGDME